MKESAFQFALSALLRNPVDLDDVSLSEQDRATLKAVAQDPAFTDFQKVVAADYWANMDDLLQSFYAVADRVILKQLWDHSFMPRSSSLRSRDLYVSFLDFLGASDEAAVAFSLSGSEYAPDLFRYAGAVMAFKRKEALRDHISSACGNHLMHVNFKVVELNHDVRGLASWLWSRADSLRPTPTSNPMCFLFIGTTVSPYYRRFQIDDSVKAFLLREISGIASGGDRLPECYSQLVEIGLCRPRQ